MELDAQNAGASPVIEGTPSSPEPSQGADRPTLTAVPSQPTPDGDGQSQSTQAQQQHDPDRVRKLEEFYEKTAPVLERMELQAREEAAAAEAAKFAEGMVEEERKYMRGVLQADPQMSLKDAEVELARFRHFREFTEQKTQTAIAPIQEKENQARAAEWMQQSETNFQEAVPDLKEFSQFAVVFKAATGLPEKQVLGMLTKAAKAYAERSAPKNPSIQDYIGKAGGGGRAPASPDEKKQVQNWVDSVW
jgi:hypothetical protein